MTITYRQAVPEDTPACVVLRGMTRENAFSVERLAEAGVTLESWQAGIADGSLPGHVATERGKIVGYCFGERETGEIAVLALLPEHEGQGAGRTLLNLVVDEFKALGFARLFLSCSSDPGRALLRLLPASGLDLDRHLRRSRRRDSRIPPYLSRARRLPRRAGPICNIGAWNRSTLVV